MCKQKYLRPLLAGFVLAGVAGFTHVASAATTTNLISNTTFENAVYDEYGTLVTPDGLARWPWRYNYKWGYVDYIPDVNPMDDVYYRYPEEAPTNTLERVFFDTASWSPIPSGGGFGMGFGFGMNWNSVTPETQWPTNLHNYILSFDARAEGLKTDTTSIWVEIQAQFNAPDNTIPPEDADTQDDRVIQVNKGFGITSNWTHYVYLLNSETSIGGGSEANLVQFASAIGSVGFGVNVHMPGDAFDLDTDNFLHIDNVKLEAINSDIIPPPPPPLVGLPISTWDCDANPVWWGYCYPYAPQGYAFELGDGYNVQAAGLGVDGGNAWTVICTNDMYIGQTLPAWSGVGSGGQGAEDMSLFTTDDLASYKITFDSRVHGLAEGATETTCRLQLMIYAADDTLSPPDAGTGEDTLIRLDFNVPASTNWTTTSYTLNKGSVGGGSKANLTNYLSKVVAWRPQFQIENPGSEATWGFDDNNVLVLDNIKFERLVVGCPPLNIGFTGGNLEVSWAPPSSGTVKLQSADKVNGTYTDVEGSPASPYNPPASPTPKFYRTVWVPPAQ